MTSAQPVAGRAMRKPFRVSEIFQFRAADHVSIVPKRVRTNLEKLRHWLKPR